MTRFYKYIGFTFILLACVPLHAEVIKKNYSYFTLWVDCDRRSAIKFDYLLWADSGNYARPSSFYFDPYIPNRCEQKTTNSYASVHSGYDRGHLVASNHMDFNSTAIKRANYMTNILPQVGTMNRGAWLRTEEIAECYREYTDIRVIGGPVWSAGVKNTYFLNSHGVKTPNKYWKVLIKQDYYGNVIDAIGWIIPNSTSATKSNLNNYLKSINAIENATGQSIPVPSSFKYMVPSKSWSLPSGCDLS
ncbi:endonuclease G [Alteromonadaceae bacterium 2753L.S.0a.02]|nr:endonuclease G [Alteromonadaceae bacterium 2753L.S.0a.02]